MFEYIYLAIDILVFGSAKFINCLLCKFVLGDVSQTVHERREVPQAVYILGWWNAAILIYYANSFQLNMHILHMAAGF